ncbi:MAG: poly-beta-1,6-N-acetyl-D-glucosamine biosynthesis protein PgaD [Pseudomonadota bacterium]
MAKSGQRPAYIKIIDKPELKSGLQKFSEGLLTLVCWGLFACLAKPLFSYIMQIFDIRMLFPVIDFTGGINDKLVFVFYFLGTQPKIIDKPELKSPVRYLFEGSFTFALWALWAYWLMPLLTLCLWVLGFHLYYTENLIGGGFEEIINALTNSGSALLVVLFIMLGWTVYNYLWFLRRGERRNKSEAIIFDEDIAKYFNVDLNRLRSIKKQSLINITIDNDQIILPDPIISQPD